MSLSHQPIAEGNGGKGGENEGNNEREAALVSEMMGWITSLCICHGAYPLQKMRSRKFAGRLRAEILPDLAALGPHVGALPDPWLLPGEGWRNSPIIIMYSKSFLLTDLHLQSPSCMLPFPSKIPPRQGYSEPPPLPLRLETAVSWQDASVRLIGTDALASRKLQLNTYISREEEQGAL